MAVLLGLGAFHGLNPGMGWLFAVALGLQEGNRRAVLRALPPLALGHAVAITLALLLFEPVRRLASPQLVAWAMGGLLISFGVWHLLRRRHPTWGGMRLRPHELAVWSFVMASAHGAGLMLLPVLDGGPGGHPVTGLAASAVVDAGAAAATAAAAHTAGMLAMMGGIAVLVYDQVGVAVLRKAWVNLDVIWWVALVTAGVFALFT